jgi:hypothetical protein
MRPCIFRAPGSPLWQLSAALAYALLLPGTDCVLADQPAAHAASGPAQLLDEPQAARVSAGAFEVVRRFDFNERPLGNYEETPLNWERLEGEGLPHYSVAKLDDHFGHLASPSLRFDLQGGSIGYEYVGDDLPLAPGADHLVIAYVRAVGLQQARAFIQVTLLDDYGQPIPGGERISELVASIGGPAGYDSPPRDEAGAEPWQRVEVSVPSDSAGAAAALRLTLWVMQAYAWRVANEVDPILRQDIGARVWFDDLTVYRLPHVDLRLSSSGAVVHAGNPASFTVEVRDPIARTLRFQLSISDSGGGTVHTVAGTVPDRASPPVEPPIPPLAPGTYIAHLRLCDETESFGNCSLSFAVVDELPDVASLPKEFGIELGQFESGDPDGLVALVRELGCGAAKIGFSLPEESGQPGVNMDAARDLVRKLLAVGVDVNGALLPPHAKQGQAPVTLRAALSTPDRSALLAPLLFPLGGALSCWQVGGECIELGDSAPWDAAALDSLRRDIRRYVAAPQFILPVSIFEPTDRADTLAGVQGVRRGPDPIAVQIPAELPTCALPAQLAACMAGDGEGPSAPGQRWLMLDFERNLPNEARTAELARRLVLAKVAGADRIFVPAPISYDGQTGRWFPTPEFVAVRTLFRLLGGRYAAAALPPTGRDTLAVLFSDHESAWVAAWSWRDPPGPGLMLSGGSGAELWDMLGQHTRCEVADGQVKVPLGAAPVILGPVDAGLIALQASVMVEPNFVDADNAGIRPMLMVTNPFAEEMVGTIRLTGPSYWRIPEPVISLRISSGQCLERPIELIVPPRELAGTRTLGVQLELSAPVSEALALSFPLQFGLRDIESEVVVWWQGDDLLVEQTVRNHTQSEASFSCFCRAAGRQQLEGALVGIAPGTAKAQVFQIPDAREIAGGSLILGLKKSGGRCVESAVTIPP